MTSPTPPFRPFTPSPRDWIVDDLRHLMGRLAANEGWFQQVWMGVPVWQQAEDLVRLQAVVHAVRPTWIIETGTKFGGSAIFFASLLKMLDRDAGGVLTVDVTLTAEAREVFATHPLGPRVKQVLEADAADAAVVTAFRETIAEAPGPVLVFLDDNHNAGHVLKEMELYAPLVTPGSYLIVADTIFADLAGTPVGQPTEKYPDVAASNPRVAIELFLARRDDFEQMPDTFGIGPSNLPDGFLRRSKPKEEELSGSW